MRHHKNIFSSQVSAGAIAVALLGLAIPASAFAQATSSPATEDASSGEIGEIIVTAQKRAERISDIGMSITAVSGDALKAKGISSISDFAKIEPSFTFAQTASGTPTYTIRGVGYHDFALAAPPTVSVYIDEVPLAFSAMTKGADMDLARVEILKGPQGTLFGQNSTGGAINFIAAKPTAHFEGGIDASLARFNALNVNGFVSGPLSDTLGVRLSYDADAGGAWQRNYTRDDSLGDRRFQRARLLVEWKPSDRLSINLNINGWRDRSDTQAGQLTGFFNGTGVISSTVPQILASPLPPSGSNRAANWNPDVPHRTDENFYQVAARVDYEFSPSVKLTSISSYAHFDRDNHYEITGIALPNNALGAEGYIRSFSQELRLSGTGLSSRLNWVAGLNYADDEASDTQHVDVTGASGSFAFTAFGGPQFFGLDNVSRNRIRTKAAFFNLDYKLTDHLSVHAGGRYTDSRTKFAGCTYDPGDGSWAAGNNVLQSLLKGGVGVVLVPPGGCTTLDATLTPAVSRRTLHEDNFSWRTGLDWKPMSGMLLYATVSKGYKAGAFPTNGFLQEDATAPVSQESVMAYEAGFKTFLFDRSLQLDGAYFHYDYKNKQVLGALPSLVFGTLFGLINIPKSAVDGFELAAQWRPVRGLTLRGSGTYLDSRVTGDFINITRDNRFVNFKGEAFPFTPKWSVLGGFDYEHSVTASVDAFVGVDYAYRTGTYNSFGKVPFERIKGYGLLDLRMGLRSTDNSWSAEVWGRNVTNTYYWVDGSLVQDTTARRTGKPATYGVRLSYRFH